MKIIILGCGSSMGVPRADGFFGKCDPNNKKNVRTRCSALLKTNYSNILITPKNFKPSVTVFTYGPQVDNVLSHLEDLALNHEIFLNVFIPSIVSPNSLDLLEESLHTTDGKLIIIEESINGFGVGAYWLSRINKELRIKKFHHLFPKDWIPSGKHEDEVLASKEKMIESIRGLDNE